jgi:hypothetical protein
MFFGNEVLLAEMFLQNVLFDNFASQNNVVSSLKIKSRSISIIEYLVKAPKL